MRKAANQSLERNADIRHCSCYAPAAPAAVVAHLTLAENMKKLAALILFLCLAGRIPAQSRTISIPEIETLAESGYRGTVVVSGYYFYHSEQDAIYQTPDPSNPNTSYVLLELAPIYKEANAADWRARQKLMQVFDRQFV